MKRNKLIGNLPLSIKSILVNTPTVREPSGSLSRAKLRASDVARSKIKIKKNSNFQTTNKNFNEKENYEKK